MRCPASKKAPSLPAGVRDMMQLHLDFHWESTTKHIRLINPVATRPSATDPTSLPEYQARSDHLRRDVGPARFRDCGLGRPTRTLQPTIQCPIRRADQYDFIRVSPRLETNLCLSGSDQRNPLAWMCFVGVEADNGANTSTIAGLREIF